jgi:hypothetical protein
MTRRLAADAVRGKSAWRWFDSAAGHITQTVGHLAYGAMAEGL